MIKPEVASAIDAAGSVAAGSVAADAGARVALPQPDTRRATRSTARPRPRASAMPAADPSSGLPSSQEPASAPTATDQPAQVTAASAARATNRRSGNPVAPAVRLTATRPSGT